MHGRVLNGLFHAGNQSIEFHLSNFINKLFYVYDNFKIIYNIYLLK